MNRRTKQSDKYQSHVTHQALSGLSIRQYCQENELNYHTFMFYRRRFKQQALVPVSNFVEAKVKPSERDALPAFNPVSSEYPIDPVWLADFVKAVWRAQ